MAVYPFSTTVAADKKKVEAEVNLEGIKLMNHRSMSQSWRELDLQFGQSMLSTRFQCPIFYENTEVRGGPGSFAVLEEFKGAPIGIGILLIILVCSYLIAILVIVAGLGIGCILWRCAKRRSQRKEVKSMQYEMGRVSENEHKESISTPKLCWISRRIEVR